MQKQYSTALVNLFEHALSLHPPQRGRASCGLMLQASAWRAPLKCLPQKTIVGDLQFLQ